MENNKSAGKKPAKAPEEMAVGKPAAEKTAAIAKAAAAPVQEEKAAANGRKAPVKKTSAPKKTAVKKKRSGSILFLEYSGKQIAAGEVLEAVKKDYLSKHEDAAVKTLEIYIKPEEDIAYYAVDGEGSDQYKITL
uniref:DUF6465 family protein n=1 Tax=Clostridium sp. NkU-1 TaxID=1095009 RepID=UPI0006D28AAF